LESLRHRADEALYDAKDAGRNRVALATGQAADSPAASY
jgi:PleD family two-component response regulator